MENMVQVTWTSTWIEVCGVCGARMGNLINVCRGNNEWVTWLEDVSLFFPCLWLQAC